VIGLLLLLGFGAAQGAAIFATAFIALRLMGRDYRVARLPAMLLSYAGWVAVTIVGYGLLGGEGGLMDGFGLLLMLCFTALISTFVYTAVWMLTPRFNLEATNG
jgi:hypothetical protein